MVGWDLSIPLTHWVTLTCFKRCLLYSHVPILARREQTLLDALIFNWLIGNNDAHGKNFSLVYRGEVSSGLQTRLAPLYDLISTVYYPELSPKMAMKLGGEYLSERIAPANFERLAEEAGLAKPMMKRRVWELAEAVVSKVLTVTTDHPVTVAVAKVIRSRCERKITSFKV